MISWTTWLKETWILTRRSTRRSIIDQMRTISSTSSPMWPINTDISLADTTDVKIDGAGTESTTTLCLIPLNVSSQMMQLYLKNLYRCKGVMSHKEWWILHWGLLHSLYCHCLLTSCMLISSQSQVRMVGLKDKAYTKNLAYLSNTYMDLNKRILKQHHTRSLFE